MSQNKTKQKINTAFWEEPHTNVLISFHLGKTNNDSNQNMVDSGRDRMDWSGAYGNFVHLYVMKICLLLIFGVLTQMYTIV